MLAVSQSGETKDVHRALVAAIKEGLPCLSVVNAVGSLIARTTQVGVYCHAGRENAVASTKAFTTQVTVMALVACWFRQLREDTGGLMLQQSDQDAVAAAAAAAAAAEGAGPGSPTSKGGKLKLKRTNSPIPGRESTEALMEALQRLPISFGVSWLNERQDTRL